MEAKVLLQKENQLKVQFNIKHGKDPFLNLISDKLLCGAVYFQLQAHSARCVKSSSYVEANIVISVRYLKMLKNDNAVYKCNFSSIAMGKRNVTFTEDETWHHMFLYTSTQLHENSIPPITINYSCDVDVQFDLATVTSPLATLYDDTELCDFQLCNDEGSVSVHSVILASFSPYFKTLFAGEWKEKSEGCVKVAYTSKETLEHLKDYIYLNKLPETGIQELLLLGAYYMIPDLVQKCSVKLLNTLNSENLVDTLEFAVKFKVTNLLQAVLNVVQSGSINTEGLQGDEWMKSCQATKSVLK